MTLIAIHENELTPRPTRPVTAVRCARSTKLGIRFDIFADIACGCRLSWVVEPYEIRVAIDEAGVDIAPPIKDALLVLRRVWPRKKSPLQKLDVV